MWAGPTGSLRSGVDDFAYLTVYLLASGPCWLIQLQWISPSLPVPSLHSQSGRGSGLTQVSGLHRWHVADKPFYCQTTLPRLQLDDVVLFSHRLLKTS